MRLEKLSLVALVFLIFLTIGLATQVLAAPQANEVPQTVLSADFETGDATSIVAPVQIATSILTTAADEIVAGKRSLKGDARGSNTEWNEFFHSRQGLFKAKEAYRITFDYKILARNPNTKFYALFRRSSQAAGAAGNVGWTDWQGDVGATGHVETSFTTRNADDYYLIIGIQNQGAIAIDNLVIKTDPANHPPDVKAPAPVRTWKSPGHTTYYVDSVQGNDANDGKSGGRAWQSLNHINAGEFGIGDKILLKVGSSWQGFLAPGGSGTATLPIVLSSYGDGPKPKIDAQGWYLSTLYLFNVEGWEVNNLDIANTSKVRVPNLTGVQVRLEDFGTAHHIQLKNLDIHDVSGSLVKAEGGGSGISCSNGGSKVKSRFDGLLIEGCHLQRTDRNGITMGGNWSRVDWYPSLHVIIRNNLLEDIGGDGIVPIGTDGTLIEHNVLHGGRQRCDDYAAGIWPWSCDNTTIQFNEVSGMKGTRDGQGYDCDWNCRNTLFQYNYSHNNDGGFMLICNDGTSKMPWNIGNVGSIIRYNISQNDGERLFHITGPCRDTQIYNNTFYVGKDKDIHAVLPGDWGGAFADNTRFPNNLFYVEGKAKFDFGGMTNTVFENNVFWGNLSNRPTDAHAITADPKLLSPGSATNGFASLRGYQLLPGSPCIGAGKMVENNGGRDFWGHKVPSNQPPDIGAYQAK